MKLRRFAFVAALPLLVVACGIGRHGSGPYSPPPIPNVGDDGGASSARCDDGRSDAAPPPPSGSDGGLSADDDGSSLDGRWRGQLDASRPFPSRLRRARRSRRSRSPAIQRLGEPGPGMTGPDLNGAYATSVAIPVGMIAYKLILNGAWEMDPGRLASAPSSATEGRENSAVWSPIATYPR